MPKNYYTILGITPNAGLSEIRAAYRHLARELHPDHSGLQSDAFIEVQEAYSVLSDAERRRRYDQQHSSSPRRQRRPKAYAEEIGVDPYSISVGRGRGYGAFQEVFLTESFHSYEPSFEELFDRFWRNFESIIRPKSERAENLTVEIVVSPEEARHGGQSRIWIPARAICAACRGRGAVGPYECRRCGGQGELSREYPIDVGYPAGIRDGYAVSVPLNTHRIENFYLTVVFRVGRTLER